MPRKNVRYILRWEKNPVPRQRFTSSLIKNTKCNTGNLNFVLQIAGAERVGGVDGQFKHPLYQL